MIKKIILVLFLCFLVMQPFVAFAALPGRPILFNKQFNQCLIMDDYGKILDGWDGFSSTLEIVPGLIPKKFGCVYLNPKINNILGFVVPLFILFLNIIICFVIFIKKYIERKKVILMFVVVSIIIGSRVANYLSSPPFEIFYFLLRSPLLEFLSIGTLLLILYLLNKNKAFFVFGLIFILNFLILFAMSSVPVSFWSYIFYLKPNLFGL